MDQSTAYVMGDSTLMNQNILASEISFDQAHFWHWFIRTMRGFDEQKELNLDEAIQEITGLDLYSTQISEWTESFLPTHLNLQGRNYHLVITPNLYIDIQFTHEEMNYYLNDLYIGNIGGHFEAWFFSFKELQRLQLTDLDFLLLLPMLAVEQNQSKVVIELIAQCLSNIKSFQGHEDYIASCVVNGLTIKDDFYLDESVGVCNQQNHSIRNLQQHLDDREHIQKLNELLNTI